MQGVCVGRTFRGFETKVISLELDGRFQYNFVKGFILCRGLTICFCFVFEVGWHNTRSLGSVGDVGDSRKENIQGFISSFVGMGSRSYD